MMEDKKDNEKLTAKVMELKEKLHRMIYEFERENKCVIVVTFYGCESKRDMFTLVCSTG